MCKRLNDTFTVTDILRDYPVGRRIIRDWLRTASLLPDDLVKLKKIKAPGECHQPSYIYEVEYIHPDILAYYHADHWTGPVPAVLANRLNRCGGGRPTPAIAAPPRPPAPSSPLPGRRRSMSRRRQDAEEADRARALWDGMVRCRRALSAEEET